MVTHPIIKGKRHYRCQKCGGQLIRTLGDIGCLQCGARHTEEGRLVTNRSAQESHASLTEDPIKD